MDRIITTKKAAFGIPKIDEPNQLHVTHSFNLICAVLTDRNSLHKVPILLKNCHITISQNIMVCKIIPVWKT